MKTSLTGAVVAYKKTGQGWQELSKQIYLLVYNFPKLWTSWDEDRCSEFFLSFHPRVPRLVKKFEPTYSFETYLFNSLRWSMKTFAERMTEVEHYETWCIEESQGTMESFVPKEEEKDESNLPSPKKSALEIDEAGVLMNDTARRRILCAVLLRAGDFGDHDIPRIARLIGLNEDWLLRQTHKIRNKIEKKLELRERLREKRNEYWYQLSRARKKYTDARDSEQREKWKKKADLLKDRHRRACRNIREMSVTPSHKSIGEIVNVPTGTVSSGLHFLRRYLNEGQKQSAAKPYVKGGDWTDNVDNG